jgi:hypothetical protein
MDHLAIVVALVGGLPDGWFTDPILPPDMARGVVSISGHHERATKAADQWD